MDFHASIGPCSTGHWPGWDPAPQLVGNNMKWAAQRQAPPQGNRWESPAFSKAVSEASSMLSALKCRDLHLNCSLSALQPPCLGKAAGCCAEVPMPLCLAAGNHEAKVMKRTWGNLGIVQRHRCVPTPGRQLSIHGCCWGTHCWQDLFTALDMDTGKDHPSE